jgi:hypothetical protein
MSGGSSSGSNTSKSSSRQALDPAFRDAYFTNLQRAQGIAEGLGVREFAGFTPDQTSAFNLIRQFAAPTSAGMQQAAQGAGFVAGAAGYQPQMVTGQQADRAGVRDVSAASGAQNMAQYMNPFQQDVVDVALGDIERARQMQQMQGAAQAQRAGAFGGSRQGVAEALTNEAALREAARTSAQLRSQGFETAAGLGMQDAARQLQAQASNQGVDMSLEQANAQLRQQALLANQGAGLQGAQQSMQAGAQLADIGALTQNLGFTQAAQLGQIGQQQQALSQAQMDAIRNLPLEQQAIINEALGLDIAGGQGMVATSKGQGSGSQSSRQFSLLG